MQPLVNIMLPVFNGMPLLKATIESIRRQTYGRWQCIICDDGSTDGTWEYLKEETLNHCDSNIEPHALGSERRFDKGYSRLKEPRFLLLQNDTNRGRGYTRQRILEASTGTYICMLDAGDLMHPDRIKLQVEYLETHPQVGLVSSAMLSFGLHTDKVIYRGRGDNGLHTYDGVNFPCFAPSMFRNPKTHSSHLSAIGPTFPEIQFSEDQYFLNCYFAIEPKYFSMGEALYYYSEFDSVTKSKIRVSYLQNIHIYLKQKKYRVAFVFMLKYLYSLLVFPFLNIENIVARRGRPVSKDELAEFTKYGKSLV